ncbi:hypothetical protein OIU85_006680 [Salix viminalis]|uniref:Thioredoxin domain-containing protein n=1 Tax=Salix viminalis TaxID=40686 RepID=A0A9Q0SUF6_SALVM|nr:hypothetical protein OIU85_006680 [Salix viminalis]
MRRRVTNQLSREKTKGLDYINDKLSRKKGFHFRGEKKIPLAQDKGSEILLQKLEIYSTGGQTLVKLPVTMATVNEEFIYDTVIRVREDMYEHTLKEIAHEMEVKMQGDKELEESLSFSSLQSFLSSPSYGFSPVSHLPSSLLPKVLSFFKHQEDTFIYESSTYKGVFYYEGSENPGTNSRRKNPVVDEKDVVVLTEKNFSDFIATNRYVMVEFYASWCYWSRKLAPEYSAAATLLKGEAVLAKDQRFYCNLDEAENWPGCSNCINNSGG